MDSEKIVEELLRNLSFEIETATQNNPFRLKNMSKSTPLNIKVRVRKKNETSEYGVISIPRTYMTNDKIRLANSDQTVMSFDLFMETDIQNKPTKKHRKRLMQIIRQGTCLGTQENDEDLCYLPSSSYKQTLKEQSVTSKSDYSLNQPTTLSKQHYINSSSTLPKTSNFLGKCKPGGCLDPPYGEDKYPYTPTKTLFLPTQLPMKVFSNKVKRNNSSIKIKTENTNFSAVDMSIANDQKNTNIVLKLYEAESVNTSLSTTLSNSIITYPPTLTSSECRIENDNNMNSSIITDINKNTANQLCNAYFIPPKKVLNCLEKKISEVINLSVEKENILKTDKPNNDTLDNNSAQNGIKKPTDLNRSTYINTIPNENNIKNMIGSVKKHQQYENGAMWKISHSQLDINKVQKSEVTTPNEYFLVQNDSTSEYDAFESNDTEIEFFNGTHESQGLNKLGDVYLSNQSDQQILSTNNHSFEPFKYLNCDITSKILADLDHDVQMNIHEKNTITLNKSFTNTNIVNKKIEDSVQNITQQLSNDLNTTISKHSEIISYSKPVTEVLYNTSTSSESFMLRTKKTSKQNLPETSLKLTESINLNDRNRDKNVTSHLYIESQTYGIKNILSEKVDDDMVSYIVIEDKKSNDKNNVSPGDTIIDAINLNVKNKIKTLARHSLLSENKRSAETIQSSPHTKKKSFYKISLQRDESLIEKCELIDNDRNNLEYVQDVQIVTHISKISLNKEEERYLKDNSNIFRPTEEENVIKQLSTKVSPIQELDTVFLPHNSRGKNLKQESTNNTLLMDIKRQNSSHNQIFLDEKCTTKGSVLSVRNNEKNETEMSSQLTRTLPKEGPFLNMKTLSKSDSQLIPLAEILPFSVIESQEVTNDIYKQNTTIKATPRLYEIDNLSDQETVVRSTSLIYADKQLINQNLTLSADKIKDELNINSDADVQNNTDTNNLQGLGTKIQNVYSDENKVKLPKHNFTTISHSSLIQFENILTKENDISLDMALSYQEPVISNTSQIFADKKLVEKDFALSADKIKIELNIDSDADVQNNTDASDLQELDTQIKNVYSDVNKVELSKHNLTTISHSILMQSENKVTVNDKKNVPFFGMDLSDYEPVIRNTSRIYAVKQVLDKDSALSIDKIKDELSATVNDKKNIKSLDMALSDYESVITNTSQTYADKQLVDKNSAYSGDQIKDELYVDSNDYVYNNTNTSNLQELGTQIEDIYSDINKVELSRHNLTSISHNMLMQSENIVTVNDKENVSSFDMALSDHEPFIRNISQIYAVKPLLDKDSALSTDKIKDELAATVNDKKNIKSLDMALSDYESVITKHTSQTYADKQLVDKNSAYSGDQIKDELYLDSNDYVYNNTDTSNLQELGTQIQDIYSDMNKVEIPKPNLTKISHSSPTQTKNVLTVNNEKNKLSLDIPLSNYDPDIRNTSRVYTDKQLINRNSVLSVDKIKSELDKDPNSHVQNNTDTSILQEVGTEIQNVHSDASKVESPKPKMITISHNSLTSSKNASIANDMKDDLFLDFAFQVYSNDTNQRFLRSYFSEHEPERYTNDTLFQLKTDIKTTNYKLIIPINSKNELSIHINKANNRIDLPHSTSSKGTQVTGPIKLLSNAESIETKNELRNNYLLSIWENELMPLQTAIKGLKKEIDSLVKQQLIIKNNINDVKKTKLIRVPNVGRQCGCLKSFY